jgi:bacterioferritin
MENKQNASEALFNITEIKRHAMASMKDGALTSDYALDVDKACQLLNEALATEILCVLRYRHHAVIAKGINFPQVAAEFKEHAANEDEHVWALAERIDQLGGNPDFNPETIKARTATEYGSGTGLVEMIREDLVSERIVIEVYRKMIEWFGSGDTTTRRLLEKILADEEEHASDLADLLVVVNQKNLN